MNLRKSDLIQILARRAEIDPGLAREAINILLETITQTLGSGTPVSLPGFGRFEVRERTPHRRHDPKPGLPAARPVRRAPTFAPAANLKAAVQHEASVYPYRHTNNTGPVERPLPIRVTGKSFSRGKGAVRRLYPRHSG